MSVGPLGALEDGLPELVDEPARGWRAWRVIGGDLVSLNDVVWPAREAFTAACANCVALENFLRHPDVLPPGTTVKEVREALDAHGPVPARDCACGVYTAKSLGLLADAGYAIPAGQIAADSAWGSVKLWGRVVNHDRGYRAQYAYPETVIVGSRRAAELVRRNYGCEVILDESAGVPASERMSIVVDGGSVIEIGWDAYLAFNDYMTNQVKSYSGPLDPIAIGRWFGGIIAQMASEQARRGGGALYSHQIQVNLIQRP